MAEVGSRPGWLTRLDALVPLGVSMVASAAVAIYLVVTVPQVGAWAWLAVATPVAFHAIDVGRDRQRRRSLHRPVSTRRSLQGVDLGRARLRGRSLRDRDLSGARMVDADLSGSDLTRADLSGARLHRAELSGASLRRADCEEAVFYRADLTGADLSGAKAAGASFEQAILGGASLSGADLRGADFDGADARGANFARSTMDPRALDEAITDRTTVLPTGARARVVEAATEVGWRSVLAGSTGLAAWQAVRALLVGAIGAATVAGAASGTDLAGEVPGAVEVASAAERGPGDHSAVLDEFGVTERDRITVQAPGDQPIGDGGTRGLDGASTAELLDAGRGADDHGDDPAGAFGRSPGRSDPPDPGSDDSGPQPGPDLDAALDGEEAPGPQVLGLVVERGLQVMMGSAGGTSSAVFDSAIGTSELTVYAEQRYDFDGAPPGLVSIVVTPDGVDVVSSCTIVANGMQQSVEGNPGEPVACELTVDTP